VNSLEIIEETINNLSKLMGEIEAEEFNKEGFSDLSMQQLLYLEAISNIEHPTFGDLAEKFAVSKPSVTAIVKKLIQLGYVRKIQSQKDLRVYHIELAERGEHFTEMHDKTHKKMVELLTKNLTLDEIDEVALALQKMK
jgi:DNA-binding MarR family transcriptional regulator